MSAAAMAFANMVVKSPIGRIPFPVFGSVAVFTQWARHSARSVGPAIPMAFPAIVGGLWFIWPAVDPEFKIEWGFMKDPNAKPKEAAPEAKLDVAGKKAADNAYKPAHADHHPTQLEIQAGKELRNGEFTTLEQEWDTFLVKVSTKIRGYLEELIFHLLRYGPAC